MKYNILIFICVLLSVSFTPVEKKQKLSQQEFYGQFTKQPEIINIINDVNKHFNYDLEILIAICWRESKFNPKAIGYNNDGSKDRSLFQINSKYFDGEYINDDLVNITLGISHFDRCMEKGKSVENALRIYNSGSIKHTEKIDRYVSDILLYAKNLKQNYEDYFIDNL